MKKDKFITDFEDIPTPRQKMPHLSLEERALNFKEVELGFTEKIALRETSRCLSCRRCIGCGLCLAECDQQAIIYDQKEEYTNIEVDSIVLATGIERFDAKRKPEFGYTYYPNVITNIEMERIMNANGPYGGIIMRPSDGEIPQRIAFIQCVGSRDEDLGVNYCSNICCTTALKQAMMAMDRIEGLTISIFYSDIRPFSKNSESYYLRARNEYGINFIPAKVKQVQEDPDSSSLTIRYLKNGTEESTTFDLVVLSTGITPSVGIKRLSRQVGARLNKYGFFPGSDQSPVATTGEGVWFAGSATHPTDLSTSLIQASAVAAKVLQALKKKDVRLNNNSEYPIKVKERKSGDRIGVFFCRYGLSSQLNVDNDDVIKFIQNSNADLHVGDLEYVCNTTGKNAIIETIEKENLGQVIIAPCYFKHFHLKMFQTLIQSAGLSKDQLSILNIEKEKGVLNTEDVKQKLLELIESNKKAESFPETQDEITKEASIIGCSVTALQSALDIAEQGYQVHHLVTESEVGITDRQIFWHSENIDEILKNLHDQVSNHPNIQIHKQSQIVKLEGEPGNYTLLFKEQREDKSINIGAIVLALGADPYKPVEYFYNENQNVITQGELNKLLLEKDFNYQKVVMIQCVGSRQPERPYCSQICCEQAIKNALKIKEIQPDVEIHILHRDIRVYDFEEDNYTEAIENGIHFIRMDKTPEVNSTNGKFLIKVIDRLSTQLVCLEAELIVLSNGIIPHQNNDKIGEILHVPLNGDGFLLEHDNMMKPLHCNRHGIFVAGLAHNSQRLENALMQASTVAGKIGVMFRSGRLFF